jgi:hypothetical protein
MANNIVETVEKENKKLNYNCVFSLFCFQGLFSDFRKGQMTSLHSGTKVARKRHNSITHQPRVTKL